MYRMQWERANIDISAKNRELIEKISEVDSLKRKYEESLKEIAIQPKVIF